MVRNEPIEQPYSPARGPTAVDVGLRRGKSGAGNVEVRRGRIVDETLQELRGRDGAARASAGVLHIGEFRIDELVVFLAERHAPDALAGFRSCLGKPVAQAIVVREQAG